MNIVEFINTIVVFILNELGVFAPILACLLILIESMVPILPLSLFITLNAYYMGNVFGFIVSYIFTCIGCYISYKLCDNKLSNHYYNMLDKQEHKKLKQITKRVKELKLEELTLIVAMPFTPAFMVNIASGIAKINKKKYLTSILIGKISLVGFWQFIGTSLIESINNPYVLMKIIMFMLVTFMLSKIINRKFRME